ACELVPQPFPPPQISRRLTATDLESPAAAAHRGEYCCRWRPRPTPQRNSNRLLFAPDRQKRADPENAPLPRTPSRSPVAAVRPDRKSPFRLQLREPVWQSLFPEIAEATHTPASEIVARSLPT